VSFDEVKARVSIEQVLDHYGLLDGMTRKAEKISGLCRFHEDSKTKSFKADLQKNVWNCFGACQTGGDVLDLVIAAEHIETGHRTSNRRKAALLLAELFGIESERRAGDRGRRGGKQSNVMSNPPQTEEEEATVTEEQPEAAGDNVEPVNPPLTFELKHLDPEHPYLTERGLTPETIATFGIGYHAGKGTMHGRIVIPIHNESGELVAYAGRWPGDPPEGEPKYKFPSNFHKSLVLFNLHRSREYAGEGLIVVEGFFSVFELWAKGRKNVVCVMGSHVSPEQEQLIVATVGPKGRVLVGFDPDPAGRKGMQDAAARLAPQVFVRTVELS
jgi:DNA primase